MEPLSRKGGVRLVIVLGLISYTLQFTWESLQCEPFFIHPPSNWIAADMFGAAMGDVAVTYIVYIIIAWISKSRTWFLANWSRQQWMLMLGIGLVASISFELLAKAWHGWGYTKLAPLIPVLQISIVPVLQYLILFPAGFAVTRYILKPARR